MNCILKFITFTLGDRCKTPNYCLILSKLFTFGIAQASLTLLSLNHNFQDSSLVICKSKLPSLSLSMSCILKFIKVYGLLRIPRPLCNGLFLLAVSIFKKQERLLLTSYFHCYQ